jgi:hypothetical protein
VEEELESEEEYAEDQAFDETVDPHARSFVTLDPKTLYQSPPEQDFFRDLKAVLSECNLIQPEFLETINSMGAELTFPKGPAVAYVNNQNRKF